MTKITENDIKKEFQFWPFACALKNKVNEIL